MTYRNRMSKPKRHLNLPYWIKNSKTIQEREWFDEWLGKTCHKVAYIQKSYSDTIDPFSGKYIGWIEMSYKERSLKKRHRAYARILIAQQILLMQEMEPCPYCGSEFCENHLSCKDEEEKLYEFEREMYEREMNGYFFYKLEEEEFNWESYDSYEEIY